MTTLAIFQKYFLPPLIYYCDFGGDDEEIQQAMANSHNDEHDCFGNKATAFCQDCQASYGLKFSRHCRLCLSCTQCENCYLSVGLYQQTNRLFCVRNHDWEFAAFDREVSEDEFIDIYGQVAAIFKNFPLLKSGQPADDYQSLWESVTAEQIAALLALPASVDFLDILQEEIKADQEHEEQNRQEIDELLSGLTWEALKKKYLGVAEEKDALPLPPPEQKFLPHQDKENKLQEQIEILQEQVEELQKQNEDIRQMLEQLKAEISILPPFRSTSDLGPWREDIYRPRVWMACTKSNHREHE